MTNPYFNFDEGEIPKRSKIFTSTLRALFGRIMAGFDLMGDPAASVRAGVTTGLVNAYKMDMPSVSSYENFLQIAADVHLTNTTRAVTLEINALGTRPVLRMNGAQILEGDMEIDTNAVLMYNTDTNAFYLLNPVIDAEVVTGVYDDAEAWLTAYFASIATASQAEMEAGTSTAVRMMTPQRVSQGMPGKGALNYANDQIITLNASTAKGVISVNSGSENQRLALPDITTMPFLANDNFVISNQSGYPRKITTSAGVLIGSIPGYGIATFGVANTANDQGWRISGMDNITVVDGAETVNFATAIGATFGLRVVTIDANREMLILAGASTLQCIVWDKPTMAFGTPLLVRNAVVPNIAAALTAANQVLILSCTSTTAMEAVHVTVDPVTTALTLNTAAATTLPNNVQTFGDPDEAGPQLVQRGSNWVLAFQDVSSARIIAINCGALLPVIGTSANLSGTSFPAMFECNTSEVLCISAINASSMYVQPYTVSGAAILTAGTQDNWVTTGSHSNTESFVAFPMGSQWAVIYSGTSNFPNVAIISCPATTATSNRIALSGSAAISSFKLHVVSATKAIFCGCLASTLIINVITNTAGVPTIGTAISIPISGSSSSIVRIDASTLTLSVPLGGAGGGKLIVIAISGVNPLILFEENYTVSGGQPVVGTGTMRRRQRFSSRGAFTARYSGLLVSSEPEVGSYNTRILTFRKPLRDVVDQTANIGETTRWFAVPLSTTKVQFKRAVML